MRKNTPYVGLSDEELAYIDRSLREGLTMGEIGRKLGYRESGTFSEAIRRRGMKRGSCLVSVASGEKGESGLSEVAREREYQEITEVFSGKRRATIRMVARLLRIITAYCDLYVKE